MFMNIFFFAKKLTQLHFLIPCRSLLLAFLLNLAFIILCGCQKNSQNTKKKLKNQNILNVIISDSVRSFDPAVTYDAISLQVISNVHETLFQYHYLRRPYTLIPLLAQDFPDISADQTTYTFKIKKNVMYHPHPVFNGQTRFLVAQDFVTQFKRIAFKPTQSKGVFLFENSIKGFKKFSIEVGESVDKMLATPIEGVRAIDDETLVIELIKPQPHLLMSLAMTFTAPVPAELVKAYQNQLGKVAIGTGPFSLKEYQETKVVIHKYPHYYHSEYPREGDRIANESGYLEDSGKKIPFLEEIQFYVIPEPQAQWLQFNAGKIDYLVLPKDNFKAVLGPSGDLNTELKKNNVQLQIAPSLTYWWLSANMKDPVIGKNIFLRKAIAHAINIEEYIKLFTNNSGQRSYGILPPGLTGYDPSTPPIYEYNLEKARAYMKKAGYLNPEQKLELTIDIRRADSYHRQVGEYFQRSLEKIGIKLHVVLNSFPNFLQRISKGEMQLFLDGWTMDYPDPENALQLLSNKNHPPGPNSTYYSNSEYQTLFENAVQLPMNSLKRLNMILDMQKVVLEDVVWIPLYFHRNYIIYNHHVKNFRYSDLINNFHKYIRVDYSLVEN
jgi:oligopeptide transport system substrate-binding protein